MPAGLESQLMGLGKPAPAAKMPKQTVVKARTRSAPKMRASAPKVPKMTRAPRARAGPRPSMAKKGLDLPKLKKKR